MKPFNWQCPYCNHHATLREDNLHTATNNLIIDNAEGYRQFRVICLVCPNTGCRRFTLDVVMYQYDRVSKLTPSTPIQSWKLLPPARMIPFPEYVPKPIVNDYQEACSIVDLSPKVAATLARRCLQGMIRDFWKITKGRLVDEVAALEDRVDPLTWQAINAVKNVGNIGAHMEKDINVIIDVDPQEAEKLISLIEILVEDWYISRQNKEDRLKMIVAIGQEKKPPKS